MHTHDGFDQESSLRPKASRIEDAESAVALKAAMSGRLDAAGAPGMMGLQRAIGNAGTTELIEQERSPVHDVIGSGGSPMEPALRADMEGRLGHDFGDVRIHTDAAAHNSAKSVNAQAYTVGSDIVFQQGKYEPDSQAGQHMLAHELTHVVQQRNGPVDGTDAGGGVKVSNPSDRFEREAVANADRVMSAAPPATHDVQRSTESSAVPMVQREEGEEEEEDSGKASAQTYVQRHEDCADHDS
ncbi:eCIS core domain-containing protein [Mycobacterium sp. HM-7]